MTTASPELSEKLIDVKMICAQMQRCFDRLRDSKYPEEQRILRYAAFGAYLLLQDAIGKPSAAKYLHQMREAPEAW